MTDQPTASPQPWLRNRRSISDTNGKVVVWLAPGDSIEANADLIIAAGPMREALQGLVDAILSAIVAGTCDTLATDANPSLSRAVVLLNATETPDAA